MPPSVKQPNYRSVTELPKNAEFSKFSLLNVSIEIMKLLFAKKTQLSHLDFGFQTYREPLQSHSQ